MLQKLLKIFGHRHSPSFATALPRAWLKNNRQDEDRQAKMFVSLTLFDGSANERGDGLAPGMKAASIDGVAKNKNSKDPVGAVERVGRGDLDSVLGFHLRLAHGRVYRHFTETFSELGLTQKQVSALWLIADWPGLSQTELSQQLQMDRATTTEIINRLAARGLLRRDAMAGDRRKQALYLEPPGKALLEQARQAIHDHESWLKSRFSPSEVDTLIDLLNRIHS